MKERIERMLKIKKWKGCAFCGNGLVQMKDWKVNPELDKIWAFCDEDCIFAHIEGNLGLEVGVSK